MSANLWMGLRNAQVSEGGNYFSPGGVYDVEITRCLVKQTQKSGIAYLVETEVLASNHASHPPGSSGTWFQKMASPAIAFSAIKGFLYAVLGLDLRADIGRIVTEVDPYIEALADFSTSERNPLAGMYVHLETHQTKTKEKGADFTVHRWAPFQFAAMGISAPDVGSLLREASTPRLPVGGGYVQAPPPPPGAYPGAAPQLSPDGRFQLVNNVWQPYQAAQLPPPPPPPQAPPPPPPAPSSFGPMSPDGRYRLIAGQWVPV